MINKTFFQNYIHYSILLFASVLFTLSLDTAMVDDGLRHLSFAANQEVMENWGKVFPHSLFSEYDPWLLWHELLRVLLLFIPFEMVHIPINIFAFFVLMIFVDRYIRENQKYDLAALSYIMIFVIIKISFYRYVILRPDMLSGLFVMFALLLKNRVWPVLILTIIYGPFYYLFFLYTGSVGLVYMVQKKWKAFFSIFIGSLIVGIGFLVHDYESYLEIVKYILTDQSLRMGLDVREGMPIFSFMKYINYFILVPIFLLISFSLIYWKYEYFKNNALATFLLITSILWINQLRYLYLFFPLIYTYLFLTIININQKAAIVNLRKFNIIIKRSVSYAKKRKLFYLVAIPYTIIMLSFTFTSNSSAKYIKEGSFFKEEYFTNKRVLINSLGSDLYKALYYNPTMQFIPSCSIGWFEDNKKMKDIYIRMQKAKGVSEKELSILIKYVDADLYIHYTQNDKQVLNFEKLKNFGIIPNAIYKNRIIFEIDKKRLTQ